MSAPANDGSAAPVEKKGLNKYLSRMKTVLKRSDSSKRLSFSGKSPAGPSETKPAPKEEAVVAPEEPKEVEPKKILRSQIQADRAKKLGERFAIAIQPFEIKDDREILRVEKPIRMRIHRTCHKCQTTFGGNKVCEKCGHPRCKSCPRFPPKSASKDKGKGKGKENEVVGFIEPDSYWNTKEDYVLTIPSKKTGGQPLVRKYPKQRVRRTCHQCNTLFVTKSKTCTSCGHVRCTECPRDPAKKKKYPDGYPGDAFSTNTSLPVKYACSKCSKVFPAVPHPDSDEGKALAADTTAEKQKCVRCGHERCDECSRAPPQKVEPVPDPEVLKSLEAKLSALRVTSGN